MKKLLILPLILMLTACVDTQQSSPSFSASTVSLEFPTDIAFIPATTSLKARIYMTHGFGGGGNDWVKNVPFADWIADLSSKGYEIVIYDQPQNVADNFSDGGLAWRNAFIKYIPELIEEIESQHGPAPINIAGGISFGGLHSLMLAELFPEKFDLFFASEPVTDYTALVELQACSSEYFNTFLHPEVLASKPGYIQYGEQDDRVNWHLTVDLIDQVDQYPNSLTAFDMGMTGHTSTPQNLQNLTNWLEIQ